MAMNIGHVSKGDIGTTYFTQLFSSTNPDTFQEIFHDFLSRVTEEINQDFIRPISKEEIKEAVFSINLSTMS